MEMKKRCLTLTLPDDIAADIADIKRVKFTDKSYSEMYRYLIRLGLDSLKSETPPIKRPD